MYPENDYDYETNRGDHLKVQVEHYTASHAGVTGHCEIAADRPLLSSNEC